MGEIDKTERPLAEPAVPNFTVEMLDRIITERNRQRGEKKHSVRSDKRWQRGELAGAAAMYAVPGHLRDSIQRKLDRSGLPPYSLWPWAMHYFKPDTTNSPQGRLRELEKAGALVLAEMERIYGDLYEAIPNVVPDGRNYAEWEKAVQQYILLERVYGWGVMDFEQLKTLVDPVGEGWPAAYASEGLSARDQYEALYYES